MHDIDERLTQLGGSLEAAAEVRSPTQVRSRGEQIRVAHRRRMTTVTAVTAAVAVIGVGSLVAFRPAGHKGAPVGPGTAGTPSSSSKAVAPPAGATSAASGQLIAVVDLTNDVMEVNDGHGHVVKTIPVTGGSTAHPSQAGVFTITTKQQDMKVQSGPTSPSGDNFEITVHWVIKLSSGTLLYAETWDDSTVGKRNATHGDIEMSTESAQWLYGHVAVGDRIQIQ